MKTKPRKLLLASMLLPVFAGSISGSVYADTRIWQPIKPIEIPGSPGPMKPLPLPPFGPGPTFPVPPEQPFLKAQPKQLIQAPAGQSVKNPSYGFPPTVSNKPTAKIKVTLKSPQAAAALVAAELARELGPHVGNAAGWLYCQSQGPNCGGATK